MGLPVRTLLACLGVACAACTCNITTFGCPDCDPTIPGSCKPECRSDAECGLGNICVPRNRPRHGVASRSRRRVLLRYDGKLAKPRNGIHLLRTEADFRTGTGVRERTARRHLRATMLGRAFGSKCSPAPTSGSLEATHPSCARFSRNGRARNTAARLSIARRHLRTTDLAQVDNGIVCSRPRS